MPKIPVKLVTWNDVVDWSKKLARKIIDSGYQPDVIIGIARGGVTPARLLCDYLGVMDLLTIKVEHWVETAGHLEDAIVKYPFTVNLEKKKVLLVDDICDTGRSIIVSKEYIERNNKPEQLKVATMQYIKPVAKFVPDYYVDEVVDWVWYLYPWNQMEDTINLIKKILQEKPLVPRTIDDLKTLFRESYGIEPPIDVEEAVKEGVRRGIFIYLDGKVRLTERYFMP
ncbi:MAG: phosphoribosyltransferase [Fervidicoccaceae archaeon]|jgi:hypoxanthine phosphoribosyltransferase|nr:phosphoribosyltransferase [Fervidicoccaceae archaeon]MCC6052335.1 phosphoribosyltransferase [Fervidicoccaceae archaeon]